MSNEEEAFRELNIKLIKQNESLQSKLSQSVEREGKLMECLGELMDDYGNDLDRVADCNAEKCLKQITEQGESK